MHFYFILLLLFLYCTFPGDCQIITAFLVEGVDGGVGEWVREWVREWVGEWVREWAREWVRVGEWVREWASLRKDKAPLLSWATSSKPLLLFMEVLPADEGYTGTYTYWEPLRNHLLLRKEVFLDGLFFCFKFD